MSPEASAPDPFPSKGTLVLTFLAGAAVGAVVVALTTPKTGPQLRGDIKDLAKRTKEKAGHLAGEASEVLGGLKDRTSMAAQDIKRGFADSLRDLRG